MLSRLKQYVLIGAIIYGFYFLLSHHFIVTSFEGLDSIKNIKILQKKELTLKYTFYSLKQASPEKVMQIPELREVGIGDIMIENGMVTQERLNLIERKIDMQ
ncbi:MAG: hypothetical protein HZB24_13835 [Desulfobacterales bacterium]|nr:hypothetical protein [Desulfobacterales bacterium]